MLELEGAVAERAEDAPLLDREALGPKRVVLVQADRTVEALQRPDRHRRQLSVAERVHKDGEGGIRTLGQGSPPSHDFQSCPFSRSGTSPGAVRG